MKKFFREKIVTLAADQLRRGITPKKVAMTLALAVTLGLFPILGATTFLCLIAGVLFRLNHPILQVINHLLYPLQILMIPAFIRAGEKIFGAEPIPFNLLVWKDEFFRSPMGFLEKFGMAGVHAIAAWCVVFPFAVFLLYRVFLPFTLRLEMKVEGDVL